MSGFDLNKWTRENMLAVSFKYNRRFVEEFRNACKKLGVKQSDLIRQMMLDTIEKSKRV